MFLKGNSQLDKRWVGWSVFKNYWRILSALNLNLRFAIYGTYHEFDLYTATARQHSDDISWLPPGLTGFVPYTLVHMGVETNGLGGKID